MYHIDIMTLFPDVVGDMLCESILGRGQERGYIRIDCHQIRAYTKNKQNQVDSLPRFLTNMLPALIEGIGLHDSTSSAAVGVIVHLSICLRRAGPSGRPMPDD